MDESACKSLQPYLIILLFLIVIIFINLLLFGICVEDEPSKINDFRQCKSCNLIKSLDNKKQDNLYSNPIYASTKSHEIVNIPYGWKLPEIITSETRQILGLISILFILIAFGWLLIPTNVYKK